MMENYIEYSMSADLVLETSPELVGKITEEMLDAMIGVVERHGSFIGGGFCFKELPLDISAVYEEKKGEL